jgi:hypothetical protein
MAIKFKIVIVKGNHKFHIYDIVDEFKIDMVEVDHKFKIYEIANEF